MASAADCPPSTRPAGATSATIISRTSACARIGRCECSSSRPAAAPRSRPKARGWGAKLHGSNDPDEYTSVTMPIHVSTSEKKAEIARDVVVAYLSHVKDEELADLAKVDQAITR